MRKSLSYANSGQWEEEESTLTLDHQVNLLRTQWSQLSNRSPQAQSKNALTQVLVLKAEGPVFSAGHDLK